MAYATMPNATLTLSDSLFPNMGMLIIASHRLRSDGGMPRTSFPNTSAMRRRCFTASFRYETAFLLCSTPQSHHPSFLRHLSIRAVCAPCSHATLRSAPKETFVKSFLTFPNTSFGFVVMPHSHTFEIFAASAVLNMEPTL